MNLDISYLTNITANGNLEIVQFLFENGADIINLGMPCVFNNYAHPLK